MVKARVLTGFSKLNKDELATRAQAIVDGLKGNANYPAPVPSVADVENALKAYQDALTAFKREGGRAAKALRDEKAADMISLLNLLALYVQANCKEDVSVLLSSGFEARKENNNRLPMSKPENLKVTLGVNAGSVKVSVNRVDGAVSYVFEFRKASDPETTPWTQRFTTKSTIDIMDLEPHVLYMFRVAAVSTDEEVVYADVVSSFII
jgi:hypothetical protein